ncbi:ThiF family adenylyltransferase [Bradyrhizobium sp. 155]|uniref:ThiF family adenylyltransferase n=1 Tax=unclassified Bradyrhizobium TaxID=2631580 RepID=UPI001FFBF7B2|nr:MULTISPECIES: ThiF family adenylyltransferase [unclassified Bradyrhizobium]MCK1409935.1 ThiF family adenylyltransferase [Bradyrhizobium sp. 76]UPK10733.1 ThiF family adenylyltransferase [Bradyrhizobium sp. 155]
MRYSVTFLEKDCQALEAHIAASTDEQAAFLICRISQTDNETRLLVRACILVTGDDIIEQSPVHMKIAPRAYTSAMKRANDEKSCLLFVHSHPNGHADHSGQDDIEEKKLFRTAYTRIRTQGVHGSLVLTRQGFSSARVWLPDGSTAAIERIRIIGRRARFWFPKSGTVEVLSFFDRQVRAFGPDIQRLLSRLRVGIVGVGGTGSCVLEQLIRLGVGTIMISDGEMFESSNVNRVYGSRVVDDTLAKIKIAQRLTADIGLGTKIELIDKPVSYQSALKRFRECDIVMGCTDDELGRSLLNSFAIYYYVPVFDMGVKIDSEDGVIRSIQGRVTTLMNGAACLHCRGRISAERVAAQAKRETDPEGAKALEDEGYLPELGDPAPAVVAFTTTIAAGAVTEVLHRLTGFMGPDRESTEVIYLIDEARIRTNNLASRHDCFCVDSYHWGRGDVRPFLDTTWRTE